MKKWIRCYLPLRMWQCVVTIIACAFVMLMESVAYEAVVWQGPAKVVGLGEYDGHVELKMQAVDDANRKFTTTNAYAVIDYIHNHETVFICTRSEMTSTECLTSHDKK